MIETVDERAQEKKDFLPHTDLHVDLHYDKTCLVPIEIKSKIPKNVHERVVRGQLHSGRIYRLLAENGKNEAEGDASFIA